MDKQFLFSKLKKYLFFISIAFLVITGAHLVYTYIYSDSKEVAEKGGTISEGIIGDFPNLNPLKKNNDYNDYINHILYRTLLTYNTKKDKIEGDLANCDIDNLSKIECFLNDNIFWSNGEKITFEDIEATYRVLKETNINPVLKSLLQDIDIEITGNSIIFITEKKDINTLNILFQAILPEKLLNSLGEKELSGNFSPIEGVYSGMYTITNVNQDDTLGITKIFLEKNKFYNSNPAYIDKIIFKLFKDTSHFLKHKSTINIFNDKNNLIGDSIPKFAPYKYNLPQYVGLFINTEKLPYSNLRNFILRAINNEELVNKLGKENFKVINSPFLNSLNLETENQTKNLEDMLESLGYYSKEKLIAKLLPGLNIKQNYSDEIDIKDNKIEKIKEEKSPSLLITKDDYLVPSEIIYEPNWIDNYNYISKDDVLLKGKASENVDAVYINDYKLQGFKAGDTDFFYRIKKSYNTLSEGRNEYNIYFEISGEKIFKEKIVFYYSEDTTKFERYEDDLISDLNKKIIEDEKKKNDITNKEINSTELEKNNELIKKLNALESGFYYNMDLDPYSLNLSYINSSVDNEKAATFIQNKLKSFGIKVNKRSLSINELTILLKSEEKEYDLLLTGINLGYFNFNLFPYLHSSQVKSGYNFSKYKKLTIDQVLEELKSHNLSKDKILEIEQKILEILKKEAIFKTLYTPLYSNLVDKTIEGYSIEIGLPSEIYRYDPLITSYVSRKRIINKQGKNSFDFIRYLISTLF